MLPNIEDRKPLGRPDPKWIYGLPSEKIIMWATIYDNAALLKTHLIFMHNEEIKILDVKG